MTSKALTQVTIYSKDTVKVTMLKNSQYQLHTCIEKNDIYQTYEGFDILSNNKVIVHTLSFSLRNHSEFNQWKKQFFYYTLLLRSCNHSSLPKILDSFEDNYHPYIVYKYYSGISLVDLIEGKKECLNSKEKIKYIKHIAQGLKILHQKGLVHQNVKPQNIVINKKQGTAVLLNFWILF